MKLEEIHWPVFPLRKDDPIILDNISMYGKLVFDTELDTFIHKYYIIDDKDIPGDTLGSRRLLLKQLKIPLYKLTTAIYSIGDMLRTMINNPWFIDHRGYIFKYKKQASAPLTCHKIIKILRGTTGVCIIELEGINERFKLLNDTKDCGYAGVITINKKHILYGLYDKPFKKSYRKI